MSKGKTSMVIGYGWTSMAWNLTGTVDSLGKTITVGSYDRTSIVRS